MAAISAEGVVGLDGNTAVVDGLNPATNVVAPDAAMLCKAMNIDVNAPCELQRPDMDFFEVRKQSNVRQCEAA